MSNQTIIQVTSSKPLPAQPRPITIRLDLDNSGYSGLMGLLNNPALLAFNQAGGSLDSHSSSVLQSCVETASITLGNTLSAIGKTIACPHAAEEYLDPLIFADFASCVGELIPFLNRLSAELATDHAKQSLNHEMKEGL